MPRFQPSSTQSAQVGSVLYAYVPSQYSLKKSPIECHTDLFQLQIGINYTSQPNALRGCVNDARHVRDFLVKHGGYRISEILLLTDEPPKGTREGDGWDSRMIPTRDNIIRGMKWLVRGARRDDSLFFHCELAVWLQRYTVDSVSVSFGSWWANKGFGRGRGRWV